MRYRLRTLLIFVTAACVVAAYLSYGIDRRPRFPFGRVATFSFADDPHQVAKAIRERISLLPSCKATSSEIALSKTIYGYVEPSKVVDRFFYSVTLKDGAETRLGFWVYSKGRSSGVTMMVVGYDKEHDEERVEVDKRCREIMLEIALDSLAAQ